MKLRNSTEPLKQIAVVVAAVLTAVGAGLAILAEQVDWTWVAPVAVVVTALIGIVTHLIAALKGRSVVWADPNHQAVVASTVADAIAAGIVQVPATSTQDSQEQSRAEMLPSLDKAVKAAGLD